MVGHWPAVVSANVAQELVTLLDHPRESLAKGAGDALDSIACQEHIAEMLRSVKKTVTGPARFKIERIIRDHMDD